MFSALKNRQDFDIFVYLSLTERSLLDFIERQKKIRSF